MLRGDTQYTGWLRVWSRGEKEEKFLVALLRRIIVRNASYFSLTVRVRGSPVLYLSCENKRLVMYSLRTRVYQGRIYRLIREIPCNNAFNTLGRNIREGRKISPTSSDAKARENV